MIDSNLEIRSAIKTVLTECANVLKSELKDQGHYLTGNLESSIESVILDANNAIKGLIEIEEYGLIINAGVRRSRIPYNPGSGAKTSKYIDALINYFRLRGLNQNNAKKAAFATANIHKREGMPTSRSSIYSKNGKRVGFIDDSILKIESFIEEIIERNLNNTLFSAFINKLQHG